MGVSAEMPPFTMTCVHVCVCGEGGGGFKGKYYGATLGYRNGCTAHSKMGVEWVVAYQPSHHVATESVAHENRKLNRAHTCDHRMSLERKLFSRR